MQSRDSDCDKAQIAALESEVRDAYATIQVAADLLTRTANALKGEPAELSSHDWSDLPKVAAKVVQEAKRYRFLRCKAFSYGPSNLVGFIRDNHLDCRPGTEAFDYAVDKAMSEAGYEN